MAATPKQKSGYESKELAAGEINIVKQVLSTYTAKCQVWLPCARLCVWF